MRLVHDENEVLQSRKVIEVALANIFRESLDARRSAAAHFRVNLRNIENVHLAAQEPVEQGTRLGLVIVSCDDLRRIRGELRDAFEYIFGRVRREVGDE